MKTVPAGKIVTVPLPTPALPIHLNLPTMSPPIPDASSSPSPSPPDISLPIVITDNLPSVVLESNRKFAAVAVAPTNPNHASVDDAPPIIKGFAVFDVSIILHKFVIYCITFSYNICLCIYLHRL